MSKRPGGAADVVVCDRGSLKDATKTKVSGDPIIDSNPHRSKHETEKV